jgi:Domain of unknown function (DUF4160)
VPNLLHDHGLRYFFWSNEGSEPPHVHVERDDDAAKFWLEPVRLAKNWGLSPRDLQRATLTIKEHEQEFLKKIAEHR